MLKKKQELARNSVVLGAVVVFGCLGSEVSTTAADEGAAPAPVVEPADSPFAVVELFTSEGCSSCPPADQLLIHLSEQSRRPGSRLYPLVFHVDYWDRLGWPDGFAKRAWSQRQRDYARAWRSGQVYTPQAVVNGREGFVGSRRGRMETAVERAFERSAEARVQLEAVREGQLVRVGYEVSGRVSGASLELVLVQESAGTEILRGENRGRTLRHANVVRDLRRVSLGASPTGRAELELPEGLEISELRIIALVQDEQSMAIRGAASVGLSEGG